MMMMMMTVKYYRRGTDREVVRVGRRGDGPAGHVEGPVTARHDRVDDGVLTARLRQRRPDRADRLIYRNVYTNTAVIGSPVLVASHTVPTLLLTKNPGLFQDPMKNFPRPFRSPRMFKYKEKRHLLTIFRV